MGRREILAAAVPDIPLRPSNGSKGGFLLTRSMTGYERLFSKANLRRARELIALAEGAGIEADPPPVAPTVPVIELPPALEPPLVDVIGEYLPLGDSLVKGAVQTTCLSCRCPGEPFLVWAAPGRFLCCACGLSGGLPDFRKLVKGRQKVPNAKVFAANRRLALLARKRWRLLGKKPPTPRDLSAK